MQKQDMRLVEDCIDTKNQKQELNYALFDFNKNIVIASNTKVLIEFKLNEDDVDGCSGLHYVHKKYLKLIIGMMKNDVDYKFNNNCISAGGARFTLDNQPNDDHSEPFDFPLENLDKYLREDDEYDFTLDSIEILEYDAAINNAFVLPKNLLGVQEHGNAQKFGIKITPQRDVKVGEKTKTDVGSVKVVGIKSDMVRFTFVAVGIEYKAPVPTLFN
jgi:hypothetical protein